MNKVGHITPKELVEAILTNNEEDLSEEDKIYEYKVVMNLLRESFDEKPWEKEEYKLLLHALEVTFPKIPTLLQDNKVPPLKVFLTHFLKDLEEVRRVFGTKGEIFYLDGLRESEIEGCGFYDEEKGIEEYEEIQLKRNLEDMVMSVVSSSSLPSCNNEVEIEMSKNPLNQETKIAKGKSPLNLSMSKQTPSSRYNKDHMLTLTSMGMENCEIHYKIHYSGRFSPFASVKAVFSKILL